MTYTEQVLAVLRARDAHETEFLQAVYEVFETIAPVLARHPHYQKARILERMVEPERTILFRVPWIDDQGNYQINRGYRVQ